jgi:hypothetical protein
VRPRDAPYSSDPLCGGVARTSGSPVLLVGLQCIDKARKPETGQRCNGHGTGAAGRLCSSKPPTRLGLHDTPPVPAPFTDSV